MEPLTQATQAWQLVLILCGLSGSIQAYGSMPQSAEVGSQSFLKRQASVSMPLVADVGSLSFLEPRPVVLTISW